MSFRILLVDDSTTILFVYRKLLQKQDIIVDTAETVSDAMDLLSHNTYDTAIVDLNLTELMREEGWVILKYIKEFYPKTNVILVTASGSSRVMKLSIELGADYYFEKPFPIGKLKDALQDLGMANI